VPLPRGFDAGRDSLRAGSPVARLMALADPNSPSGSRMLPQARELISESLRAFNEAGVFAPLESSRFYLAFGIQQACDYQHANAPAFPGNQPVGSVTCAEVAQEAYRELLPDRTSLASFLDALARNGFAISVSYGPVTWSPAAGNSFAAHYENMTQQQACSIWWTTAQQLGCK
jgi:hypothetical protein